MEGSDDWPVNRSNSPNRTVQVFLGVVISTPVTMIERFLFVAVVFVMFPMVFVMGLR